MCSHKVLCLFFLSGYLFIAVCAQYSYDCDETFCSRRTYPCPELKCKEKSRLIENATQCGCCHVCIEQLEEGDKCKTQELAVIPRLECGPGLKCDKEKLVCVPMDTYCIKNRVQYDRDQKAGSLKSSKSRPECDEFGFYKPVECISNVLCYCVDKDGRRIFGTDLTKNRDSMNCNCSIDFEEFPRDVPVGDFLRCMPNGNYDALQCTENWCYCMGDSFHIAGTVVKANTTLKDLLCYDRQRHQDDDATLRSKCLRERNTLLNQVGEYENKGIFVIGVDLPKCDLDGSYSPVQCKKDKCFCVKRNGELYDGYKYKLARSSKEAKSMTCKCIRDTEMLSDLKNEEVQEYLKNNPCDINGNYK